MKAPNIVYINNATIALYPMREVEAVTAFSRFYAGSWHEGENWGAHHLLEHVMFDGSENFPTEEETEIFKEENGIYTNGVTGKDWLTFSLRMPKDRVSEGLFVHFDSVFRPLLEPVNIEREKTIIQQEYKDKWSSPYARFSRASDINLFGKNHPYVKDGMGEISYVATLTKEDLEKIHKQYVAPANMVFVCVGNFDENEVIKILEKELKSKDQGKLEMFDTPPVSPGPNVLYWREDVQKVSLYVDWFNPKINEYSDRKQFVALNMARYIIGGSTRSLLWKELRKDRGWVYSVGANYSTFPDNSMFTVSTSTDHAKAQEVLDLLISTPKSFVEKGVPDDVFKRSKNFINSQTLINYDSVGAITEKISSDLYRSPDNHIYLPSELNQIADSLTQDELRQMIGDFLSKTPFVSILSNENPNIKI